MRHEQAARAAAEQNYVDRVVALWAAGKNPAAVLGEASSEGLDVHRIKTKARQRIANAPAQAVSEPAVVAEAEAGPPQPAEPGTPKRPPRRRAKKETAGRPR